MAWLRIITAIVGLAEAIWQTKEASAVLAEEIVDHIEYTRRTQHWDVWEQAILEEDFKDDSEIY